MCLKILGDNVVTTPNIINTFKFVFDEMYSVILFFFNINHKNF